MLPRPIEGSDKKEALAGFFFHCFLAVRYSSPGRQ